MASPAPVRTGNDQVDMEFRLYRPLMKMLGFTEIAHVANAVGTSIVNAGNKTPDEVAQVASNAMKDAMDDLVCAYNIETKQWQWYNVETGKWGGPC